MGRTILAFLCVLAALFVLGCGGAGGGSQGRDPTVRFYNGSPDSPDLDFLMDSDVMASFLAFLEGSASFVSIEPGERDIVLRESGTTNEIDAVFGELPRDTDAIFSAIGLFDFQGEFDKRIRIAPTEVDRSVPNGNTARLIIIHGFNRAFGFATPNIDFQNPGDNPQFKAPDIAFAASATLVVDAVPQIFQARRAGTEEIYASITLLDADIDPGKVYAVYVLGVEGEVGAQVPQIVFVEIETR